MDVICDTNIWYGIGSETIDANDLLPGTKLIATYNSIDELARTKNLLRLPEETKKSIQSMFRFSVSHAIYVPPLIHLRRLSDPKYQFDVKENLGSMVKLSYHLQLLL